MNIYTLATVNDEKLGFGLLQSDDDNINVSNDTESFQSLVILDFSPKVPQPAIQWILDKIQLPKQKGGSELRACPITNQNNEIVQAHIGAPTEILLFAAERMDLKKVYKDGYMRELCLDDLTSYKNGDNVESFLTMGEKQRIILHELQSIRAKPNDFSIASMPNVRLYSGEPIIPRCLDEGIIISCIAMHDAIELGRLSRSWFMSFFSYQPLDAIENYFGQTIAMYFAFLGHYTYFLVPPAIFGVICNFVVLHVSGETVIVVFSLFNLVWATLFFECWKRRTAELAFAWGTIDTESFEEPRPQYRGEISKDPVTERLQPHASGKVRRFKIFCVSVPVMIISVAAVWYLMILYFYVNEYIQVYLKEDTFLNKVLHILPSVLYALSVTILNIVYHKVAVALNNWENHRLQSDYENNLVIKVAVMSFANHFFCMFYLAFIEQDMILLRKTLATMLVTNQITQQFCEALLPYVLYKFQKVNIAVPGHISSSSCDSIKPQTLLRAEIERVKDCYSGVLEDYLELFIQFGYVFLFSAVYPTAAFWAFANNVVEIRSDSFKLCRVFRRPFSQPTENIGVWEVAFEIMGVLAVITNFALIALSPVTKEQTSAYNPVYVVLFYVLAEHVVLCLKVGLAYAIPNVPKEVQIQLDKMEYHARRAWRRQRCRRLESEVSVEPTENMPPPRTATPQRIATPPPASTPSPSVHASRFNISDSVNTSTPSVKTLETDKTK